MLTTARWPWPRRPTSSPLTIQRDSGSCAACQCWWCTARFSQLWRLALPPCWFCHTNTSPSTLPPCTRRHRCLRRQAAPSARWRLSSGPWLEFSGLDRGLRVYRPRRTFRIRSIARSSVHLMSQLLLTRCGSFLDVSHNHKFADKSSVLRAIDLLLTSLLP